MIHYGMKDSDYRALTGLSGSVLSDLWKSPAHYMANQTKKRKESPAMALGTAAHCMILEGEAEFNKRYVVADLDLRTNAGKAMAAEIKAQGLTAIDPEDAELCRGMMKAVHSHETAKCFICTPGKSEVSVTWHDDEHNADYKGRIDRIPDFGEYIVDLKTTADIMLWSPKDYLLQAAHYLNLLELNGKPYKNVMFVVVENSPPFSVRCVQLDSRSLELAQIRTLNLWQLYRTCKADSVFPALNRGIETYEMKAYEEKDWAP